MVLVLGIPLALVLGAIRSPRGVRLIVLALVWFVCLAAQTAYLAQPGRTGFGGVDGPSAVQFDSAHGAAALAYWPMQPVLALLLVGVFGLTDRLVRGRRSDA